MDRLGAMKIVLAAVDAGSLSAAGRQLGVPLATISRKLSELEAHLGTQILVRSSRRLTLTETGRAYVDACRRILEDVAEAERAAAGEYAAPRGELSIAAPIVLGRLHVLPVISAFIDRYADIKVRLMQSDRLVDFAEERIDAAIRIGALPDSSMIAAKIGETRQVICASPAYFRLHGQPASPAELSHHDCISFDRLNDADHWFFGKGKTRMSVPVRSRLVVNTAEAAIDAAIAGAGVTRVLSYQVARYLKDGTLVRCLAAFEPDPLPVNILYPGNLRLPVKLRAFLDFAAPRLKERLNLP